eukprot:TRINITY_DN4248_c0_g1_i4.p2 TRINITY_DN4248_c0_g1~~TRINITY_DN4248_c0_g1_i4.p2  ORF type:complete len:237 (+),score=61.50 TRINITY_DN4248_c0_g1_i4:76-786(+)
MAELGTTLVRYENPVVYTEKKPQGGYTGGAGGTERRRRKLPTSDILKSIIPAREWTEGGVKWTQVPSATPATRLDVINLQEQLDSELRNRRARDSGVCPVRQELYAQTFDELIREITVDSPERGVLMLRVRDDLRQTINAYRTMFESSIAFGTRKAVESEQGKEDLDERLKQAEARVAVLELENEDLQLKCEEISRTGKDKTKEEKIKFDEEMKFLKNSNNQLASLLNTMLHGKAK